MGAAPSPAHGTVLLFHRLKDLRRQLAEEQARARSEGRGS